MQKFRSAASAAAVTALASGAALMFQLGASGSAGAAPTSADQTFVTSNEQGNLAEISLGTLAGTRGQDSATKALASKTKSDHMKAKTMLTAAAKKAGATLPTAPNQMQLSVAANLKNASSGSFDLMYAQAQVTAHEQALAGARTELNTTKNAALKSYVQFYIPVATMHLHMAQAEVKALGGSASGVPAGTGGEAATNQPDNTGRDLGIGAGLVLIVAGLGTAATRRRRVAR